VAGVWNPKDELPIEIDLPPECRYHSVFACPILRQQVHSSPLTHGHVSLIFTSRLKTENKPRVSLHLRDLCAKSSVVLDNVNHIIVEMPQKRFAISSRSS
jgi:hypothetical protein